MGMPGGSVSKFCESGYAGICDDPYIDCAAWMITTDAWHGWRRYIERVLPGTLVLGERIVGLDIASNLKQSRLIDGPNEDG